MPDLSRRNFLKRLPALFQQRAASLAETVSETLKPIGDLEAKTAPGISLPPPGGSIEGTPFVHPWIGIAYALADRIGRRMPYVLLLGASGEAFRLAWRRGDPRGALEHSPVNTFLASIALAGLGVRATHGGPFEPAIGGVEVAMQKGLSVVVGARSGPAVVTRVDQKSGEVRWVHGRGLPDLIPLGEFEEDWADGIWSSGPAPFLRVTVEAGGKPRSLDLVAKVGFETMLMLLRQEGTEETVTGLAAYEAWAEDLRASESAVDAEFLRVAAVSRAAAGNFLEAIGRALPEEFKDDVAAAVRHYREIHAPAPDGGIFGSGLYPEVAECLLTEGETDPGKAADPGIRARAADLLLQIRDEETKAVERIAALPRAWRTLS